MKDKVYLQLKVLPTRGHKIITYVFRQVMKWFQDLLEIDSVCPIYSQHSLTR